MDAELWAQIKKLKTVDKLSNTEIGRQIGLDRKTVRKALRVESPPLHWNSRVRPSKLISFKKYIQERIAEYPRLSAVVLFEELKRQGYTGRIRILNEYLAGLRTKAKEVFLKIETPMGEQAQVDWANCGTVMVGHAQRKLSCFVMVLSWSRRMYIEFTLSQCLEDFLRCHLNAFEYFEGYPRKILYDNLKLVVLSRIGSKIQFNSKFMEFAGSFGFDPVPCNIARGNEKGKVESGIYYIRKNFLEGRKILWPGICHQSRLWLDQTANLRIHRTTHQRPHDLWEQEKCHLLPLPQWKYDTSIRRAVRSTHQALVRFDGNAYSVPHGNAYQTLELRATLDTVRILFEGKEIACHVRCYDRGIVIEDPKHFEGILSAKRKALGERLQRSFMELGSISGDYLEGLCDSHAHIGRHIAQIMELVATYGKQEVLDAMVYAYKFKAFGAAYIQNILLQQRESKGLQEFLPIVIPQKPSWNEIVTEEPDLSIYDKLIDPSKDDENHDPF